MAFLPFTGRTFLWNKKGASSRHPSLYRTFRYAAIIMHKNAFSRIFILYNVRVLCFCVIINAYNTDIDISDSQSCHIFNCCLDFFLYLGRYFHNILSKP